jgi:peptide/nickel transport system substrate-binding protein
MVPRLDSRSPSRKGIRRVPLVALAAGGLGIALPALASGAGATTSAHATVTSARPAQAATALVDDSSNTWTTWSYSPFNVNFVGAAQGFVYLPLAIDSWPSLTKYIPQLATSWGVKGNTFYVNLVPNAKWQNGQPVTSTDVLDTILLDGPFGGAIWNDITNVTAPSAHQVDLTVKPGEPIVTLESDLFGGVTPYPASVWGKFVTPSLKQDDLTYFKEAATNPSAASSSPAFKAMSAVLSKIASYNPPKMIGDGPYELTGETLQEYQLTKWSGFYDASKITVPSIIFEGTSQNELNAELLSGRVDFSNGWLYMPPAILDQWLKTPDANLLAVPGTFQGVVIFNDAEYPFNITAVRKALAYALPVSKMDVFSWGSQDAHAVAPVPPDGLVSRVAQLYLTKNQLSSLDPYNYDPAEAAKLLESVGFKKSSGGTWTMPNGKPFKLTLSIDASWTDQVAAFQVAASALTSFGIPSVESTVENTTYINDFHTGTFQVAAYCCAGGAPNPLQDLAQSPMGSAENFTSTGTYAGDRGIGYGPVETVPGIGKVNVPTALNNEYASTNPGPKMDQLVWDWAQFIENQVPFLEYAAFANQIAFSSRNFNWPSTSNPLWVQTSNGSYDIVLAQERGELSPK